jgi:ABC-type transport system involved in cytochrome c biogenesis ATPase subunit
MLALTHIFIEGLCSIKRLDLPTSGLGWEGHFPEVAVLGGANGSGKTTLLRLIAQAARLLVSQPSALPKEVAATACRLDFTVTDGSHDPWEIRFIVGDEKFCDENGSDNCVGYVVTGSRPRKIHDGCVEELRKTLRGPNRFALSSYPRVVVLPSENRDLIVPRVKYMAPGKLDDDTGFVAWWDRPGDQQWSGSTIELLFSARWADLNAKENGQPGQAIQFERFTRAFADLTGGRKHLDWTARGDLVVEFADRTIHEVDALSAGERQALLLFAELRRLWRPGSLVLIDELELHLHDAWQGKLYEIVMAMQKELGGQVIITTQSHALFEMATLGTRALLGREGLR